MVRKNLLWILFTSLLILSGINVNAITVSAIESPAIMVLPESIENPTLKPGESFTLSIYANYTGPDVTGYQFTLLYDPSIIHGVNVTNGDLIVGGSAKFIAGPFNNTAGNLSLTVGFFFNEGEVTEGPGTLAHVTFKVVGIGSSNITIGDETKLFGWDEWEWKEYVIIDAETMPTHIQNGYFDNRSPHDVAVASVTPSPTSVKLGELVNITVVVENQGTINETFDVAVYYDNTIIETEAVQNLAAGTNTSLTFAWNTAGVREEIHVTYKKEKTYTINAAASILPGETDTEDNTFVSSSKVKVISQYLAVMPQSTVDPTLTPGKNYTVSIYTDYNGSDVWAWQFSLSYNPNVLEGIEVVNGDLISEDKDPSAMFIAGTFDNTLGELSLTGAWFFYITKPVPTTSGPGTLAYVTFRVKGIGDTYIMLETEMSISKLIGYTEGGYGEAYNIINDCKPCFDHILHGYFRDTEEPVTHDIAVLSVTPFPTSVKLGELVNITVVVENQGTMAEIFDVEAYYAHSDAHNYRLIGTQTVTSLEKGTSINLTFTWDTTAVAAGNCIIIALVEPLLGETDTNDNTFQSDEIVTVSMLAIYIRADGSVDPPTASISSVDNITYTLTGNIYRPIIVERSNIIIEGNGYKLKGYRDQWGFFLSGTNNVTIRNTNIEYFVHGVCFDSSSFNTVFGNNITDNHLGIYLTSSSNNIISGNNVTANARGIKLEASSNNSIFESKLTNNREFGIWLDSSSSSNVISGNMLINNDIGIAIDSSRNIISGNNITNNHYSGIILLYNSSNSIIENNITNNHFGICLHKSSNNSIYHNNFIDNTKQVYDELWNITWGSPSINMWDDGYPSGGNYWSDYTSVDLFSGPYQNETGSDGIWDHPYTIDANNRDRYPLTNLWSPRVEHDLSVRLDTPNFIEPGHSSLLNATVYNLGLSNETNVELGLLINDILVNSTIIDFLPVGASYTLSYIWTPTDEAIFSVTANAKPVSGENITVNNVAKKIVTVTYPLIRPVEGQWANYTLYYFDYFTGEITGTEEWKFTHDHYISPYIINITVWFKDRRGYTSTGWIIVNIMNRRVESSAGAGKIWAGMWYHGWIETDITLGSTINLLYGKATVVGSRIIEVGEYSIDCWELECYEYTLWYDKVSGLLISVECTTPASRQSLGWDIYMGQGQISTNIPLGVLPVASFTYSPSNPFVGEAVTFNASASYDPDGTIVSYSWDFGDGTFGSGMTTPHVYAVAGTYTVTLTVTDDDGLARTATSTITASRTTLEVDVDVGSIHFRGEMVEFYVLVSLLGKPVNADLSATLYYSNGTLHEDLTDFVEHTDTGLYRVPYTISPDAPAGTYVLVVNASFLTLRGASLKSFLLSPTLTSWNAWLIEVHGDIATIRTDVTTIKVSLEAINAKLEDIEEVLPFKKKVANIKTDIGIVKADLADINAELVSLYGTTATIKTDVGTLDTDTESIELKVIDVDGDIAIISTILGTIRGRVLSTQGDLATIETDIGVVEAPLPATQVTSTGASIEWALLLFAAIVSITAIAAVLLRKLKGTDRTKPTTPLFLAISIA